MMIRAEFTRTMSKYNKWQNNSLYSAANSLSDTDRKLDRGAFFGSIHETLCHLLWGDMIWMNRFAGTEMPPVGSIADSKAMFQDWDELWSIRTAFDETIIEWSKDLDDAFMDGLLTWHSGALGRDVTKPVSMLITHMFNHQTHHRGQVHAMLTQAGAKPEDTDLFAMA